RAPPPHWSCLLRNERQSVGEPRLHLLAEARGGILPTVERELVEHVLYVPLGGELRDVELPRNRLVAVPLCHEREHLALAARERCDRGPGCERRVERVDPHQQSGDEIARKRCLPVCGSPERANDAARRDLFAQDPYSAAANELVDDVRGQSGAAAPDDGSD